MTAKKTDKKTAKKSPLEELVSAHQVDEDNFDDTSKVKQVMASLDDGQEEVASGPTPKEVSEAVYSKKQLASVERPNGDLYRPRKMRSAGITDVETLRACRKDELPVLLSGYPGCGKTAMMEAAFGEDLYTVEGHGELEVSELLGSWQPNINQAPAGWYINPDDDQQGRFYDGKEWTEQVKPKGPDTLEAPPPYIWKDGPLLCAMKEGKVLFVDDITLIPTQVLPRLHSAMDGRKVIRVHEHDSEQVAASEGFFVAGAHNPGAPGAVLSEALASRFLVQFEVESDLSLALELGVPRTVVRAARNMRKRRQEGSVSWAPEMRELLAYRRVAETLGRKAAADNMVGAAPPVAREALIEALGSSFPGVEAMRLNE